MQGKANRALGPRGGAALGRPKKVGGWGEGEYVGTKIRASHTHTRFPLGEDAGARTARELPYRLRPTQFPKPEQVKSLKNLETVAAPLLFWPAACGLGAYRSLEFRRPEPQLGRRWEDRCVLPNPGARGSVWERDRNARGLVRREESSGIQTAPRSVAADRSAPREPEESQARPGRRARHPAPAGAGLSPAFLPSFRQNT
ncbi:unnamed protein product [Rangifer tarandus platyrhynchus]|uniref:Uncharacterized protein n=2 Tax=Rangifer tarandus platyrhynchus TaxID=3082113 RepID=A0ABN8YRR0_RANTA|nr:unnamed protein product [Rangifer tarandus platyrhynchus]